MTPTPYYDRDGITIYHADCRDILPTIDPATVDLLLTDPPYGVDHDTDYTRFTGGVATNSVHQRVAFDAQPFDPTGIVERFKPCVLFGANAFSDKLPRGSWLVWDKRSSGGAKNVMSDGETAWHSRGHGVYIFSHAWDGFNRASERGLTVHPTQKPVALMAWILERWTKPGDLILDPYMGSGPVARAAQLLGRRYIGIELVETYCAAAVNRLAQPSMFAEATQ